MTLFDAMHLLGLSAPITHEAVDRACMDALWRVWGPVHQAPDNAELAAQAQLWDGEIRKAYAFLRERPLNLYPYRVLLPEAQTGYDPRAFALGTGHAVAAQPQPVAQAQQQPSTAEAPPSLLPVFHAQAQSQAVAQAQQPSPFAVQAPSSPLTAQAQPPPTFNAEAPPSPSLTARSQPPPLPAFTALAGGRPEFAKAPPPPLYPGPLRGQTTVPPEQAPQRRLSGWTWVGLGAAAVLVCGAGLFLYGGLSGSAGPGRRGLASQMPGMPAPGIGAGAGVGPGYSDRPRPPSAAQRERQRQADAASETVARSGLRDDHHSLKEMPGTGAPAPASPAQPPAGSPPQGKLTVINHPDGSLVARMPDGGVISIGPTGGKQGSYGPQGSPFGKNAAPGSSARGTPQAGGRQLSPSERLALLPEQYRRMVAGEEEQRQKLLAQAEKGDAEAQFRLAEYYTQPSSFTRDTDAAERWYRKAADAGYEPAQLALARGLQQGSFSSRGPQEAATYYRKAAEQGGTESLGAYGQFLLLRARDASADPDDAIPYLKRAAQRGHTESQYLLGHEMINPYGKLTNYSEGLRLLEQAAGQGHGMARYTLACTYLDGTGRPADPERGVRLLTAFIEEHPYPIAILKLADCYRDGYGVQRDSDHAVSTYRHWQTLPSAQYRLCLMYHFGEGVAKDEAEALQWLQLASACYYAPAQYDVGMRHATGAGLERDDVKAAEAFRKAALQHYPPAQTELGLCYLDGRGVDEDPASGIQHLERAAALGFPKAQENLGRCYARGRGVRKDPAQAAEWLAKAAAQDYGPAQIALGRFLLESRPGHPGDPVLALAWFLRAEALKEDGARECVQQTREQLPPQDIAEAERRASQLPRTRPWKNWQPL